MVISEIALGLFTNLLSDKAREIFGEFYTPSLKAYNEAIEKLSKKYNLSENKIDKFLRRENVKVAIKEYLENPNDQGILKSINDELLLSLNKNAFSKMRASSILSDFFDMLYTEIESNPLLSDGHLYKMLKQTCQTVNDVHKEVHETHDGIIKIDSKVNKIEIKVDEIHKEIKNGNNPQDTTLLYVKDMYDNFCRYKNLDCYIDMRCTDDAQNVVMIDNYVKKWLEDEKYPVLAILGDFGTGKTTYVYNLVKRFAAQYIDNNDSYLPVLIRLKDFTKDCKKVEDLLNIDYTLNILSINEFRKKLDSGKILFIFDGFDELPNDTIGIFKKVNSQASKRNKIVITSRTHYFEYKKEEKRSLHPKSTDFTGILLDDDYKVRIVYINLFTEDDIRKYLEKKFGNSWEAKYEIINKTYNLRDLSSRPILLDLITRTLPELSLTTEDITLSKIYDKYINGCMDREKDKEKWNDVDPKYVYVLMEELSFKMFCENKTVITLGELKKIIYQKFSDDIIKIWINIKDLEEKIRTASFIYRDSDDNFMFMHKSFMEFFIAKKISEEINKGIINRNSLGKMVITQEIINFIKELIKNKSNLLNIIEYTRGKTEDETGFLGGNAITLLKYLNHDFRKNDFSSTVLSGADLSNCNLSNTCFRNSLMKNVKLSDSILKFTDFTEANLVGTILDTTSKFTYLAWSPNCKYFATIGDDDIVRIWDASNYRQVKLFHSQDSPKYLSWSKELPLLICGNSNGSLNIWNVENEKLYARINFQQSSISAIAQSDDRLICGDLDGYVFAYDLEILKEIQQIVIKGTQQIKKNGYISKLVSIDSFGYILISSGDGLEALNSRDLRSISLIGKDETPFCVDEKANKIIYTEWDPKLPDWNEEKITYTHKLYSGKISSLEAKELRNWDCRYYEIRDDDDHWNNKDISEEFEVIEICGDPQSGDYSLILYEHSYLWDADGYYECTVDDIYTLIIVNDNRVVKKILLDHIRSHSWYGERKSYSHHISNLCYSPDGSKITYLKSGEIKIINSDLSKDSFGEHIKIIKRSINCEEIIINDTIGLDDKQIKFIQENCSKIFRT